MKKAVFKVKDGEEIVKMYEMEYRSAKELHELFQEARRVWDEFMVEIEFDLGVMSSSHTYRDQVLKFGA